jgi:pimeloyl-ACP methyl ester carboxylesterase
MNPGGLDISLWGRCLYIETLDLATGPSSRPVLVFLHEGLGSAASWKAIPETLGRQTRCPVFSYSRPGYGSSCGITLPRKINYLHTEALTLLPKVLEAARIDRYILIGHSDGGSISLIHGGRPADRSGTKTRHKGLKGIITLAAHLFCEDITQKGVKEAKARYETGDLKARLKQIHGSNTHTAFWGWNQTWLAPGFRHWNIEKYLKHIPVPVLGIQGVDDPFATLAQLDAMESGIADCCTATIEACGHIPHFEQPETTLSMMADFIKDIV